MNTFFSHEHVAEEQSENEKEMFISSFSPPKGSSWVAG